MDFRERNNTELEQEESASPIKAERSSSSSDYEYGPISSLLESGYLTGRLLDWSQTRKISRDPVRYSEKNSYLGEDPSQGKVDAFMALGGLGHYLLSKHMPEEIRVPLQIISAIDQWKAVKDNRAIGLKPNNDVLFLGALLTAKLLMDSKKASISPEIIGNTPGIKLSYQW